MQKRSLASKDAKIKKLSEQVAKLTQELERLKEACRAAGVATEKASAKPTTKPSVDGKPATKPPAKPELPVVYRAIQEMTKGAQRASSEQTEVRAEKAIKDSIARVGAVLGDVELSLTCKVSDVRNVRKGVGTLVLTLPDELKRLPKGSYLWDDPKPGVGNPRSLVRVVHRGEVLVPLTQEQALSIESGDRAVLSGKGKIIGSRNAISAGTIVSIVCSPEYSVTNVYVNIGLEMGKLTVKSMVLDLVSGR